jgi:pimeloyl-ACP methyl ester carboxylesterase
MIDGSSRKTTALAALVAGLAAAALFNRTRARRAERETPPAGRFVDVDGMRLHLVERGQGQPVVLLHGNGVMVQDMETSGLLDRLAVRYRVIAVDRPGFGYTDRPRDRIWTPSAQAAFIGEALRRIGVERPIVVGHSWGTLAALAMALEFPDDVRALVLLSGYYFPTPRADVPILSGPAIPFIGDIMRHTLSPIVGRAMMPAVIRRSFQPAPVPARFADFPTELALRPSQIRAAAADTALMIPGAVSLSPHYASLSVPTVIVAGAGDRIVDFQRHSARLHDAVAGSELRVLPGIGHMVHHSAPDEVVAAIDRAMQRVPRGRHEPLPHAQKDALPSAEGHA